MLMITPQLAQFCSLGLLICEVYFGKTRFSSILYGLFKKTLLNVFLKLIIWH
jgi:hypothetical protein